VITDPIFYLLAVPAVVALGLSKGGFAGIGQIATPILALAMPPLEAAAILLPIMIVQDAAAVWVYRKDYSRWNLAVMLPGAVIGTGIAWLLAAHISDAAVRVALGAVTILFILYTWFAPSHIVAEPRKVSAASGAFWGMLTGFTSTLCQAGSPPYQIHMLPQQLPKMTFVGTTAIFFAVLNLLKIVPYFSLGQFSSAGFATSVALFPLAVLTNVLGFWLVRRTAQETFYKITLVLLFLISLELIRGGVVQILHG
jgi:uncharacterized membrane protein YfcA